MKKLKYWLGLMIGLGVIVGGIGVYLTNHYFFNPLTFHNNDVVYLPWKWYKKPLNIQIISVGSPSEKVVETTDQKKVRLVFSELVKGSQQKAIPYNALTPLPKELHPYTILIRTNGTNIVQSAYLYPNVKLAEIYTTKGNKAFYEFIALTPSLLEEVKRELNVDNR